MMDLNTYSYTEKGVIPAELLTDSLIELQREHHTLMTKHDKVDTPTTKGFEIKGPSQTETEGERNDN